MAEECSVVNILDEKHFLAALVRQFVNWCWHKGNRRRNRLYEQSVVIDTADDFFSEIEDIFSHHRTVGNAL